MRIALLLLLVSSTAAADPEVAFAVNAPLGWPSGNSVAGSFYVGLTDHDAIRANVASYAYTASAIGTVIAPALGGDGDEGSYSGRTTDVGLAWTNYSRRLFDGFTYELGVLRRARDWRSEDEFATPQIKITKTATYAGRAQVGWSWMIGDHAFVAAAVGLSLGYEHGHETWDRELDSMPTNHPVSRADLQPEGYLRIGFVP